MSNLATAVSFTTDELDRLGPGDRAWVVAAAERELALRSPADFAMRRSHGLWLPYRHLLHTSDAIVGMVERDECDILLIEEPVRHGKTELCSRWTPAWYVLKHRQMVGLTSYEADFAATHGRRAREIVAENGPGLGALIDDTSRAAHRWELREGGAGMWTAGAGGPITGKGFGLGVIDDPIKNAEEANSAVTRDHLWEWWTTTFLTRRNSIKAKILVIMSRWHEDDLLARIAAHDGGMRVRLIRLPALAEDDDALGRVPGQALCPERFDEAALAGIRADVGPGPWSALYQQRPSPMGGGMFKRTSFRYWSQIATSDGSVYALGETVVDAERCWKFSTMDPAYTRNRRSDYTVCATWAVAPTDPPSLMLHDMRRVRVEAAEHAKLITDVWNAHAPAWVGIERQNATLALFTEAQRAGVVVRWLNPDRNKIARAETAVALCEAGRIFFPRNAPWLSEYEHELLSFPAAQHDDQVDVTSYAAAELARGTVRARKLHPQPTTRHDKAWAQVRAREKRAHMHPVMGRM